MSTLAYIAIGDDGCVTLFLGDGTEEQQTVIERGARVSQGPALVQAFEELKTWAEDNGYHVIVPTYDLKAPLIDIDISDEEASHLTENPNEIDSLLDDLFFAGDGTSDDSK